ncbi:HAMP domain-containing histidine kinase [Candidatus Saccharibacteria bacterium]|nr:HAMP domain-containing histidine kinase [Candidatus Saccharibacteria bacterium]
MNISILERIRSKYILAAFVLAGVFGSLFNLVLPVFGNYRFIWVGPLNILIFSAIMFMAIIKHRLFNLRLYAVRFLLFVVGSLVLLAVYAVALGVLYNTYDAQHMIIQLNIVITIVFLALAYTFYYGIITLTERKFGSGLLKYGLLYELSYSMLVNTDLHRMLNAVSKVFSKNMRRSRAVFVYKNDDDNELYATDQREMMWKKTISDVSKYMNRNDVDIIISDEISADSTLRQWLLDENIAVIIKPESPRNSTKADIFVVIERTPLRIYSNKEISILTTIAQMIRVATDNAIHLRQIIDLNKSLNDKIADATADLRATNRKLKKLDAVKDDFISIVSHQLRTPLTSIKGYISMLLDGDFGKLTDEQRRVLNEAYSNSERMAFLISDFLDVSRLQTGKLELRKVPTKLDELLGIEIQQLRISTATRQIELEYEPPSNLPEIDCDPHKIIQVMANMIDNAIYYSHSGGKITVSLYEQHGRIIFVVKDQGIGVPRAEQHRLFTKFYRASNAHKIRPDGSGVGLYVARKVITAHGGSLIFESTEDVGSTFGFRLPIKQ